MCVVIAYSFEIECVFIIGVGTVGAVGAIAPPLFSEELALFPRVEIIARSCVATPAPFLAHARTGRFSTPTFLHLHV